MVKQYNLPHTSTSMKKIVGAAIIWCYSTILFAADLLAFEVTGLTGALEENVAVFLESLPPIKGVQQLNGRRGEIQFVTKKALMALGYYQPKITITYDEKESSNIIVNVNAGQPVKIAQVALLVQGDAQKDKAFQTLINKQAPKVGKILNDGDYESFKRALNELALARGYFDAETTLHQVEVYPERHEANIKLTFKSGQRYQFGRVIYADTVPLGVQALTETMVGFKQGTPYLASDLGAFNTDLSASSYFSTIEVQPARDEAYGNVMPIYINVLPKTDWLLETGIGFATNDGVRFSLGATQPWVTNSGHSLTTDMSLSTKEQEISLGYRIPNGNPLMSYYSIDAGFKSTQIEDTRSNLASFAVSRWYKRKNNWNQNIFIRTDYESYEQGDQNSDNLLFIPGISLDRRIIDGSPMNPISGSVYNFKVEASSKLWLSDANFLKVWGRGKWMTRFYDRNRLISRFEQGAIWVNNISDVPPSIRFFTGGDQSIRGYSFESIAPKNAADELIGGKYLTVGSLEYDYKFAHNWRIAAFVDVGTVTDNYKDVKGIWKTGVGPGIRWVTPLGALKVDFAFAISEPGTPWRIHFSMGPDL